MTFTGLSPDHKHKNLDGEFFTARQQVVGRRRKQLQYEPGSADLYVFGPQKEHQRVPIFGTFSVLVTQGKERKKRREERKERKRRKERKEKEGKDRERKERRDKEKRGKRGRGW